MSFGRLQNSVVILQIYSSLYPSQKKKDKNSDNIWLTDTKMLPFVLIICYVESVTIQENGLQRSSQFKKTLPLLRCFLFSVFF